MPNFVSLQPTHSFYKFMFLSVLTSQSIAMEMIDISHLSSCLCGTFKKEIVRKNIDFIGTSGLFKIMPPSLCWFSCPSRTWALQVSTFKSYKKKTWLLFCNSFQNHFRLWCFIKNSNSGLSTTVILYLKYKIIL